MIGRWHVRDTLQRRWIVVVLFAVVLALIARSAIVRTPHDTTQRIAIGIDLPVSGADASDGIPTRNGVMLAIEEANAAHRLGSSIQLVANDLDDTINGKHDPAQGAQNVKSFIDDPATLAMIGPFNSNVATAEIPLTVAAGLVQISPSTTSDTLTRGATALRLRRGSAATTFFRVCGTNQGQGSAGARLAIAQGFHAIFIVDDDETYGRGLAEVFEERFRALGGRVVGHEHLVANQQDFTALLSKVRALQPDALFFGGLTSSGGAVLRKQMGQNGLARLPFFGGDGISDEAFLAVAGPYADGVSYFVAAPDVGHLPEARHFLAAYRARFGSDAGPYSTNAYAATQVEIAAIAAAMRRHPGVPPTRAEVLAEVRASRGVATPIGRVAFDRYGDTLHPLVTLYTIRHGVPYFQASDSHTDGGSAVAVATAASTTSVAPWWSGLLHIDTTLLLQQIVNGVALGAIYALVALGYTMVYGIIELINFAHGDVATFGGFLALGLVGLIASTGAHALPTVLVIAAMLAAAMLGCTLLGWGIERFAYRPLRRAPRLAPLITAIGVSFILQNVMQLWRGPAPLSFPDLLPNWGVTLGGVVIGFRHLFVLGCASVVVVALHLFVTRSRLGRAMRATAQDHDAARLMGIDVDATIAMTFMLGAALGGGAGAIAGLYYGTTWFFNGFTLGLKAFTAAVLGGIGNMTGALVGGLLIGVIEVLATQVLSAQWSNVVVFAVLVLVLVVRPSGIFGEALSEKV